MKPPRCLLCGKIRRIDLRGFCGRCAKVAERGL